MNMGFQESSVQGAYVEVTTIMKYILDAFFNMKVMINLLIFPHHYPK